VSRPIDLRQAARAFAAASFVVLRRDHVIPTPVFHPYVRVGRDYYGPTVSGLAEYIALAEGLEERYPDRFGDPSKKKKPEFVTTYIFSFLEAAVARCGLAGTFSADSPAVSEAIEEFLALLETPEDEIVCCRVVSHLTTDDGRPARLGAVDVVPLEEGGSRSPERPIIDEIPAAPVAFNREPPFTYDPPHALLIARRSSIDGDPFAAVESLSGTLEQFLLHVRLLTSTTAQSYYEVRGTASLVSRMSPALTEFGKGMLDSPVRRTARLSSTQEGALKAIGALIDDADIKREGMAMTSFDVAVRKFHLSYRSGAQFEQLVDLATALEATLAGGGDDNQGLTLRLRGRAAALLATDDDPATAIFTDVGLLYGLRSVLVHGGRIKETRLRGMVGRISTAPEDRPTLTFPVALGHAVDRMRDLVRRAILARLGLAGGPDPLWAFDADDIPVDALLADDRTRERWRTSWRSRLDDLGVDGAAGPPHAAADYLSEAER
jgi:Apea-like HEPN